jgi:hypothetical protein
MKKLWILFSGCILFYSASQGQVMLSPQTMAVQGHHFQNAQFEISYTIGELTAVSTLTSGGQMLTQGFQQPDKFSIAAINNPGFLSGSTIYPNPADNYVTLQLSGSSPDNYVIVMLDASGRQINAAVTLQQIPGTLQHNISLEGLAAGTYIIRVTSTDGLGQRSFKINKLHI